jgi:hypothetical protein
MSQKKGRGKIEQDKGCHGWEAPFMASDNCGYPTIYRYLPYTVWIFSGAQMDYMLYRSIPGLFSILI